MTKTIALAGKGGTGKTTLSALLVRSMLRGGHKPILAIDADPATNLHLALGMPAPTTVGDVREDMLQAAQAHQLGVAISRHDYLKQEVQMALEEGDQVDLLAMGRPEGQGCYCAVNHLLRQVVDSLGRAYPFVVIDNEAGMEHISRRTTEDVDLLLIVSDPTVRGLKTAAGIAELAREIEVRIRDMMLVVNRVQGDLPQALQQAIDETGLPLAGLIPSDPQVNELDALGQPLTLLEGDSDAGRAIDSMAQRLLAAI
jgi:CO dehydrogenase maturation factor